MDIFINANRFATLYNCSQYDVDDVPLEKRRNIPFGVSVLALFFVFVPLHIYCMCAIRRLFAKSFAYRIMFLLGFCHILSLSIISLLTGILAIVGVVFCSAPYLNFASGSIALFCWALTTSLSVLLAFERCVGQTLPLLAKSLFDGRRIWAWCLVVLAYSVYYGFFTIPLTFSSITANWQFNPHVGYLTDSSEDGQNLYWNSVDAIHTIVVAVLLPSLYLTFVVLLFFKFNQMTHLHLSEQKMRKNVFVQVFVLSFALTLFSLNYSLINFFQMPSVLVSINMFLWILLDGIPPFVYLSLNASIRSEGWRMLRTISNCVHVNNSPTKVHFLNNGGKRQNFLPKQNQKHSPQIFITTMENRRYFLPNHS